MDSSIEPDRPRSITHRLSTTLRSLAWEVAQVAIHFTIALVAAYCTLWVGGAVEAIVVDLSPGGPQCEVLSDSAFELGEEAADWINGGFPTRPGRTCTINGRVDQMLTVVDLAAAAMSLVAFVLTWRFLRRRSLGARRGGVPGVGGMQASSDVQDGRATAGSVPMDGGGADG